MKPMTISLITWALLTGGAITGLFLRHFLPRHHLHDEARDVIKLSAGLIATLAALVLGLLISSAKSSLDTMNSELTQVSAKLIVLDRVLANYGPETREIRTQLHQAVAQAIDMMKSGAKEHPATSASRSIEQIQHKMRALVPVTDAQRSLQSEALQAAKEVTSSRWLLIEQSSSPMPTAFLVILVFWLMALFTCFGILSPHNGTILAVMLLSALSVSGAIFLVLEMNTPINGIINVSLASLENALAFIGK